MLCLVILSLVLLRTPNVQVFERTSYKFLVYLNFPFKELVTKGLVIWVSACPGVQPKQSKRHIETKRKLSQL